MFRANLSGSGGLALTLADQGVPDGFTVTPASSYTVTYNGNTGGTVPVDPNSPYAPGATVRVLANTGNLVDTGYSFSGWNTVPDGSGTSYAAGGLASFPMPGANVTLYAQWTEDTYTVTYNGNGNTGGTVPVDPNNPHALGATVTVLANTGNLVDTGYSFSGWNTAPDGSGTSYAASGLASFAMPGANVTLYAQWTAVGQAPAITSANLATFTVGSAGTFTVTTSGSPAAALTETGALPSGVTFNDNGDGTATISGTPAAGTGGSYSVTITANNGVSPSATQSFSLTVQQPQTITFSGPSLGLTGTSATLSASGGGSGNPVVFTVDPASGSGVCNVALPGTSPATLNYTGPGNCVVDADQAGSGYYLAAAQVQWSVTVDQLAVFTSAASYNTPTGTPFSFSLTTTSSPAASIALQPGSTLPGGVTLSAGATAGTATLAGTSSVAAGVYSFTLSATTTDGTTTQAFTLTVTAPPVFTSASSATFILGQPAMFVVSTSGVPPATLSESGAFPSGVTFTPGPNGTATLAGTVSAASVGTFALSFNANNQVGATVTQPFTLTVQSGALAITSAASTTFSAGTYGTFSVTATGTPTPTLSESGPLPSGVSFKAGTAGTATLAGTPAASAKGNYPITLTATSSAGKTSQAFILTVDQAPSFTSAATVTETAGAAFSFSVVTTGYPVPALSMTNSPPAGVSFVDNGNGTGTLSGTSAVSPAAYTVQVNAANATSTATQTIALTVNAPGPKETLPAFTSAATATATAGTGFSFTVTTAGSPTAYATNVARSGALPPGVSFSNKGNGTATLSGTPTAASGGTYTVTFKATNTSGTTTQSFVLTVDAAPAVTSAATSTATVGVPYSFTVRTTGYPVPSLTTGTLPAGLSFTDNGNGTGTLSGTPNAGTGSVYKITISAVGSAVTSTQTFTLTVRQPPVITSAPTATATHGTSFSFTFTATGYPLPTFTHTGTVAGLKWATGTGTLTLSGTPTKAGTYKLTITATNSSGNAAQTFTLTVT